MQQAVRRLVDEPAAREHDLGDVALALVRSARAEHPALTATEETRRLVGRGQREPHPVDRPGRRQVHAVIEDQPPVLGEQRRRSQADLARVPPGAVTRLEQQV